MIRSSIVLAAVLWNAQAAAAIVPFINEFHYDNGGSDVGEGVEIAGRAGTVLDGWTLLFYNGTDGSLYRTSELEGVIPDQAGGYGTVVVTASLQNGAPDGLALVDAGGLVRQFLSYEGTFVATSGAAAGQLSLDIGLAESSDTPAGWSLQLTGTGSTPAAFGWTAGLASFGSLNAGQVLAPVPLPATLPLFGLALGFLLRRRKPVENA